MACSVMTLSLEATTVEAKRLKAYVRHDGRRRQVGHLLGRLRSRTLSYIVDAWTRPSAVAIASMVE